MHHIVIQNDTTCPFQLSMLADELKKSVDIRNEVESVILEKNVPIFVTGGVIP